MGVGVGVAAVVVVVVVVGVAVASMTTQKQPTVVQEAIQKQSKSYPHSGLASQRSLGNILATCSYSGPCKECFGNVWMASSFLLM